MTLSSIKLLGSLFWLRTVSIVSQIIIIWITYQLLEINLPIQALGLTLLLFSLWHLISLVRLSLSQIVTQPEVFTYLLIDLCFISVMLFFTGGATNPFVSSLLISIAIAAISLHWSFAVILTLIALLFYSVMMWFYYPIPHSHQLFGGEFNLHYFGMWVNFVMSGLFMLVIGIGLTLIIRRKDLALSGNREKIMRDEQILALGTFSASVAHELNTPLSSIQMLVDEIKIETEKEEVKQDLNQIEQQLALCQQRLNSLLSGAKLDNLQSHEVVRLRDFLDETLDQWQLIRPELDVSYSSDFQPPDQLIKKDLILMHALINLLNNAGDASLANNSRQVKVHCDLRNGQLKLSIEDFGKGLSQTQKQEIGEIYYSTKGGHGVGFALSNASLNRLGGLVELTAGNHGGCKTEIQLPLKSLKA